MNYTCILTDSFVSVYNTLHIRVIVQEIVYENIYFQKNNINLLLYKFKN